MERDWTGFNNDMRKLLLNHQITFAAVWARDGDDLVLRAYAEEPEGAILCGAFKKWMDANMERMLTEIDAEIDKGIDALDFGVGEGEQQNPGGIPN